MVYRILVVATLLSGGVAVAAESTPPQPSESAAKQPVRYPAFVNRYDLTTERDLLYSHLLAPLVGGDELKNWTLLTEATKHFKKTISNFFDATVIASTITTSMPVEGNKPLGRIDAMVADCTKILRLPKPNVFVRNDPVPQAYAAGVQEPYVLVLTSGLLDLYEKSPDELRFVIGHELGHMKCRHMQTKCASIALLMILQKVDEKTATETNILPTLGLGYFCSWCRESEISADRAGLLCCQNQQTAYNALSRLLHGLRRESDWIDPNNPDFDADKIVEGFQAWESKPFVEFLLEIKRWSASHPFIPERVAALKAWHSSGIPEMILSRTGQPPKEYRAVDVQAIMINGLASGESGVDVYVKVIQDQEVRFQTPVTKSVQTAAWANFNRPFRADEGQPIFFEIWESRLLSNSLLGAFVIYPRSSKAIYETGVRWDVYQRTSTQRNGLAKVKIGFLTGK